MIGMYTVSEHDLHIIGDVRAEMNDMLGAEAGVHVREQKLDTDTSLAEKIDHTVLGVKATREAVRRVVDETVQHQFSAACIPPSMLAYARQVGGDNLTLATVIAFPYGDDTAGAKAVQVADVWGLADEFDMVINIAAALDHMWQDVYNDIRAVVLAAAGKDVKVIIETSYLDSVEKIAASILAQEAGAAYVKTSTGMSGGGATVADVALIRATVGEKTKIKASGGIRDRKTAEAMVAAGADRLGTSNSLAIIA